MVKGTRVSLAISLAEMIQAVLNSQWASIHGAEKALAAPLVTADDLPIVSADVYEGRICLSDSDEYKNRMEAEETDALPNVGQATRDEQADWQTDVANGDTKLGFVEWLQHKAESETVVVDEIEKHLSPSGQTVFAQELGEALGPDRGANLRAALNVISKLEPLPLSDYRVTGKVDLGVFKAQTPEAAIVAANTKAMTDDFDVVSALEISAEPYAETKVLSDNFDGGFLEAPTMEIMHCDNCDAELEAGRIGLCDDCLPKEVS